MDYDYNLCKLLKYLITSISIILFGSNRFIIYNLNERKKTR